MVGIKALICDAGRTSAGEGGPLGGEELGGGVGLTTQPRRDPVVGIGEVDTDKADDATDGVGEVRGDLGIGQSEVGDVDAVEQVRPSQPAGVHQVMELRDAPDIEPGRPWRGSWSACRLHTPVVSARHNGRAASRQFLVSRTARSSSPRTRRNRSGNVGQDGKPG